MSDSLTMSCPICNGDFIGYKREVIQQYNSGEDKVRVWAFCRNCGHRGLGAFGRFSEREGIEAARKLWNESR